MGTTLTGTTPATTYDSLIKVTDNGPLSGTLKALSDGLGNDSALALSTGAAAIGTTTADSTLTVSSGTVNAVANFKSTDALAYIAIADNSSSDALSNYMAVVGDNMYFATNDTERMRIDSSGNVGIGTTPTSGSRLQVKTQIDVWHSLNTLLRLNHDGTRGLIQAYTGGGASSIGINADGGNVGIGTSSPTAKLDVAFPSNGTGAVFGYTGGTNNPRIFFNVNESTSKAQIIMSGSSGALDLGLGAGGTEIITLKGTGNVGIGTDSPDGKLDVASAGNLVSTGAFTNPHLALTASTSLTDNDSFVGVTYATSDAANYGWSMGAKRESGGNGYLEIRQHFNSATGTQIARFTGNGLCFGSDTAAANALDDYEEGSWTMGIAFGGSSSGNTYSSNAGNYVKIGKQVTCTGIVVLDAKSAATGNASLTGLPFTIGTGSANYPAVTLRMGAVSFANQYQGYAALGTTYIDMEEITEAGVVTGLNNTNFISGSAVMVSVTYFV